jgi:hypothetical protein
VVTVKPTLLIAGGIVAAGLFYFVRQKVTNDGRGFFQGAAQDAATAAVGAVVDVVDGVVSGGTMAIGDVFGVPRTNKTTCQQNIVDGDGWAAFANCPLKDYADAFLR